MKSRSSLPGPTPPVPERVALRMAAHHTPTPPGVSVNPERERRLRYVFPDRAAGPDPGRLRDGGMESTFVSLFSPVTPSSRVNGGKFGERWVQMPGASASML